MGIELYAGVSGNADEAVAMLIAGTLPQINGKTCHQHANHHCGHHCDH
jgi:predicted Fe-Mo cluster-binding NifX family protein